MSTRQHRLLQEGGQPMPCPNCGAEVIRSQAVCPQCRQAIQPALGRNRTMIVILGIIAGVGCMVGIAVIGIVAAIAVPSLLRAKASANEANAIGETRVVIAAEASYQAVSGGP